MAKRMFHVNIIESLISQIICQYSGQTCSESLLTRLYGHT
jgi:hypothetical protein